HLTRGRLCFCGEQIASRRGRSQFAVVWPDGFFVPANERLLQIPRQPMGPIKALHLRAQCLNPAPAFESIIIATIIAEITSHSCWIHWRHWGVGTPPTRLPPE